MRTVIGILAINAAAILLATTASARPGGFLPPGKDNASCRGLTKGFAAGPPDPGAPGVFDVGQTEYNLSVGGFEAPVYEGLDVPIEERAAVFYPRPLACGPFPVILILHGSHGTCYHENGTYKQEWPCPPEAPLPLPSFRGYDYLAQRLASNGFVVVSISANGINAGPLSPDWNEARGELLQHHLDILQEMNTSNGPALGGLLKGRLNLQKVGTLGHSRGGEAAVRHVRINEEQGSPYGMQAVLLVAPTINDEQLVTDIPLGVVLPYCDGDQEHLGGTGYYDGARYASPGDAAPKYTFEVMGANHNYFNTYWDENIFTGPGAVDDTLDAVGDDNVCRFGTLDWPRLNSAEQQGSLIATASAFFRVHLRGEKNYRRFLKGDALPPPSAMTEQIFHGYHPPDTDEERMDINRVDEPANDLMNTLGGAVTPSPGLDAVLCVPWEDGSTPGCLYPAPPDIFSSARPPHANNDEHRATQMRLAWGGTRDDATWENEIPLAGSDFSRYGFIQLRAFVDFYDPRNSYEEPQDFSIEIEDGAGLTSRVAVSDHSGVLFFPPSDPDPLTFNDPVPHAVLNTVRVPLSAFEGVITTDIRALRLVFDRTVEGAVNVTDLALADPASNLSPVVSCRVESDTLPPNGELVNVGLDVDFVDPDNTGAGGTVVGVFSDQHETLQQTTPDAVVSDNGLALRGERDTQTGGRIYLITSRVTDSKGAEGFGCCTVTVPAGDGTTASRAQLALERCTSFAAAAKDLLPPPDGYFRIGD